MKEIIIYVFIVCSLLSCECKEKTLSLKKSNLNIHGLLNDLQKNDNYVTFIPYNEANTVSVFVGSVRYTVGCKNGEKYFLDGKKNKSKELIDKINKTFLLFKKYDLLSLDIYEKYTIVNTNYSDSTYKEIQDLDSLYVDDTKVLYSKNCYEEEEKCPYKYAFVILHSDDDIKDIKYLSTISNLRKYSHHVYYYRSFMHANTKGCAVCECNW